MKVKVFHVSSIDGLMGLTVLQREGGGLLTISWGLVCNLFESVYLNWDPALFPHSKVIHG